MIATNPSLTASLAIIFIVASNQNHKDAHPGQKSFPNAIINMRAAPVPPQQLLLQLAHSLMATKRRLKGCMEDHYDTQSLAKGRISRTSRAAIAGSKLTLWASLPGYSRANLFAACP